VPISYPPTAIVQSVYGIDVCDSRNPCTHALIHIARRLSFDLDQRRHAAAAAAAATSTITDRFIRGAVFFSLIARFTSRHVTSRTIIT